MAQHGWQKTSDEKHEFYYDDILKGEIELESCETGVWAIFSLVDGQKTYLNYRTDEASAKEFLETYFYIPEVRKG